MKEKIHQTSYVKYDSFDELNQEDQQLMKSAIESRSKAYAPYSKFLVGAAVLLENDEIILGNNQENAAYPSGLCAERVAVFSAGANYPKKKILKIAISAKAKEKTISTPIAPCGACRQSIAEYEFNQDRPIQILFMGETGSVIQVSSLQALLPFGFNSTHL